MNDVFIEKVVLITGCSTGIGLHTAVGAARAGHQVIATLRTPSRSEELYAEAARHEVNISPWKLDVTDHDDVTEAMSRIQNEYGRLDVLINNAGAAQVGTVETLSYHQVRRAMDINYFGVMGLTKAAMPLLRKTHGRVISVTSVGGVVGQPFNDAYCAAKFALEGAMESFAPVAAMMGVSVVVVEPAAVASRFVANAGIDAEQLIADAGSYGPALRSYLARSSESFLQAQQPGEVGDVLVRLISEAYPAFRVQTSPAAQDFVARKVADVDGSLIQAVTRSWLM